MARSPGLHRAFALGAACAALVGSAQGCARDEASSTGDGSIEVEVGAVGIDETSRSPVVLLEERRGDRVLPIWIGAAEARSIAMQIERLDTPRPNTHDLAKRLLDGLDARVERVTVTELRDDVYYAVLRVATAKGPRDFDARPSDAIAIALRYEAPVFVAERVFDTRAETHRRLERRGPREESSPRIPGADDPDSIPL